MTNGTRGSALALFFVLGMGFMGAMFLFARPDREWHEKVRVVEEPAKTRLISYTRMEPSVVRVETPVAKAPVKVVEVKPAPAPEPAKESPSVETVAAAPGRIENPVLQRGQVETYKSFGISRDQLPVSTINLHTGMSLRGQVFLEGTPPPAQTAPLDKLCSELIGATVIKSQSFVVGANGELRDVVVTVEDERFDLQWLPPEQPNIIRAKNCEYSPYVSVMQVGQRLAFHNQDGHMHNAHLMPKPGGITPISKAAFTQFHLVDLPLALPMGFKEERFITIKCDVHPWEYSYVTLVSHPFFAVTDAEGKFEIKGLPVGNYRVKAHHRRAGMVEKEVEVGSSGGEVEFRIELRK